MTKDAEILLLIMAANGGEMTKADARREWLRVMALSDNARAEWRRRIGLLVRAHARAHLEGDK